MTSPDQPAQIAIAPKPKQISRLWRWLKRLVIVAAVMYVIGGIVLYFGQAVLVYPGSWTQGMPESMVQPGDGEELVRLNGSAGNQIAALFGKALGADGKVRQDWESRPTVLYFYGNGENIRRAQRETSVFRAMGMNVLSPDFVGFGMSDGVVSEGGLYETADAAYDYLTGTRGVNPKSIVLAGRSLGGAAAIYLAAKHQVAGVATFSTFTRIVDVGQHAVRFYPVSWLMKIHCDNLVKMPDIRSPVFIAHGTMDELIQFKMSEELAAAARTQVTKVEVEGALHGSIFRVGGEKLMRDFSRFVENVTK